MYLMINLQYVGNEISTYDMLEIRHMLWCTIKLIFLCYCHRG